MDIHAKQKQVSRLKSAAANPIQNQDQSLPLRYLPLAGMLWGTDLKALGLSRHSEWRTGILEVGSHHRCRRRGGGGTQFPIEQEGEERDMSRGESVGVNEEASTLTCQGRRRYQVKSARTVDEWGQWTSQIVETSSVRNCDPQKIPQHTHLFRCSAKRLHEIAFYHHRRIT